MLSLMKQRYGAIAVLKPKTFFIYGNILLISLYNCDEKQGHPNRDTLTGTPQQGHPNRDTPTGTP
jgi:hypothetical protein